MPFSSSPFVSRGTRDDCVAASAANGYMDCGVNLGDALIFLLRRKQSQTIASQPFGCKFIFSSNRLSGFHHLTNARIRTARNRSSNSSERERVHAYLICAHMNRLAASRHYSILFVSVHTHSHRCRRRCRRGMQAITRFRFSRTHSFSVLCQCVSNLDFYSKQKAFKTELN